MTQSPEPKRGGGVNKGNRNVLRIILNSYLNISPLGIRENDGNANLDIQRPDGDFNRNVNLNCEQLLQSTRSPFVTLLSRRAQSGR